MDKKNGRRTGLIYKIDDYDFWALLMPKDDLDQSMIVQMSSAQIPEENLFLGSIIVVEINGEHTKIGFEPYRATEIVIKEALELHYKQLAKGKSVTRKALEAIGIV